ncbi:hypothetical protein R3P38DRAFT_2781441 [Favolaschia claudopus]|uniref:Uncharacterized protein n=1 Tax=Favolaschia claudopus TaxID=2862362 RepID=A0AAW0B428_9AGAR
MPFGASSLNGMSEPRRREEECVASNADAGSLTKLFVNDSSTSSPSDTNMSPSRESGSRRVHHSAHSRPPMKEATSARSHARDRRIGGMRSESEEEVTMREKARAGQYPSPSRTAASSIDTRCAFFRERNPRAYHLPAYTPPIGDSTPPRFAIKRDWDSQHEDVEGGVEYPGKPNSFHSIFPKTKGVEVKLTCSVSLKLPPTQGTHDMEEDDGYPKTLGREYTGTGLSHPYLWLPNASRFESWLSSASRTHVMRFRFSFHTNSAIGIEVHEGGRWNATLLLGGHEGRSKTASKLEPENQTSQYELQQREHRKDV